MLKLLTHKAQKSGVICESFFLVGEPAEQISILAREMGADLLITASHHPAFLGRIFNLDKAPVKHWAPRPVLIYHEKTRWESVSVEALELLEAQRRRKWSE
jgi:hypothetical protein